MVLVLFLSLITMGIAILDPTNQLEGRLAFSRTVRLRTDNLYQIKFWIFAEIWRPCRHCGKFLGKLSSQQNRKRLVSDRSSGLVCNMGYCYTYSIKYAISFALGSIKLKVVTEKWQLTNDWPMWQQRWFISPGLNNCLCL